MAAFDFNLFYKLPVMAMRLNGSHPDIKRDKKWFFQFFIVHGGFTIVFLLLTYSTIFHDLKNDITRAIANSIVSVFYVIVSFCYGIMLVRQKSLMYLINAVNKDYTVANAMPVEQQNILSEYVRRSRLNVNIWCCISISVSILFLSRSVALMSYYAIIGEFQLVPMYDMVLPPFLEQTKDNLISFICLYAISVWYAVYICCMYIGLIPLGPLFILHTCGQLDLIRIKIKTLFLDRNYNSIRTNEKLKEIATDLQNIYTFVENIQASFEVIYEITLKATSITLPLITYEVIETTKDGQFNMEFWSMVIGAIVFSSSPCYYCDLLMEQGHNLRQELYASGWEWRWDRRARSSLLLLLMRTERPVAIRSMFRDVCLTALTDVFHHAYTIFNVINAAW